MDAAPILAKIAQALEKHGLQAVLIGNAAAALQGAPVTTVDFDFFFSKTPDNLKKVKRIAADLGAIALHPYYPASGLIRLMRDDDGLQVDFMDVIDGVRSFEGLRRRSLQIRMGAASLRVAPLADIIMSKKAAGRPRDLAVLEGSERPLRKLRLTRKARLEALKKENGLALHDQIRRLRALTPEKRTHFLRKRIGWRMSAL
jgi:predicted nucleotidyltransferase